METTMDFGELLIEALEEAVAYKQGRRPGFCVHRYQIKTRRLGSFHPGATTVARKRKRS
jgi:hypothetical protein